MGLVGSSVRVLAKHGDFGLPGLPSLSFFSIIGKLRGKSLVFESISQIFGHIFGILCLSNRGSALRFCSISWEVAMPVLQSHPFFLYLSKANYHDMVPWLVKQDSFSGECWI